MQISTFGKGLVFPLSQDMMFLTEQVPPYSSPSLLLFFVHLVLVWEVKRLGSRTAPSQNSSYPVSIIAALQPCSVAELLPRSWEDKTCLQLGLLVFPGSLEVVWHGGGPGVVLTE